MGKRIPPGAKAERRSPGPKSKSHFGLHLTLDGYLGSARRLNDRRLIRRALAELPADIGLKPLAPPVVVCAPDNRMKDPGGYSGFVIIAESHIAIHTFPRRRFISIDVYSCKDFDPAPIRRYFRRLFGIKKVENNLIVRGKEYPGYNLV